MSYAKKVKQDKSNSILSKEEQDNSKKAFLDGKEQYIRIY